MIDLDFVLLAVGVFLIAGTIKGVAGVGLPTAGIGLMTLFTEPRISIALIIFPMILSNLWQVLRSGDIVRALRQYGWFAAVLSVGVWITAVLTADVSDRALYGVLGTVIIAFVLVNLRFELPALPDRYDRAAQVGLGAVAGFIGGLTAVWAPPMAVYLIARRVDKDEFVRATGLLITIGSIPLCLGYFQSGVLTGSLSGISIGLVIPTILGFSLGELIRARLSTNKFRIVLLYIFLVLGLNLLRRAIF